MTHQALDNFLTKTVSLSATQISQGSKSHNYIRDLLDSKWQNDPSFPWLVEGDFLSGSYARGTKIHPLDDIDVMVVLDGTGLVAYDAGVLLDASVRGSNQTGSPILQYEDKNHMIDSQKILEVFRDGIKESYPNSEIKRDGQAINVWLDSYGLGLDVVPCFHIIPNNQNQDFYYMPMGQGSTMWMKTNPKIDERICNSLDARHNNKLKPVIKLVRYWNKTQNAERLKPYHVEVLAWHIFNVYPGQISDYTSAVKFFFANAPALVSNQCADPTQLGGNIDRNLTQESRIATINKMQEAHRALNTPTLLGSGQNNISGWRKVFGNQFGV